MFLCNILEVKLYANTINTFLIHYFHNPLIQPRFKGVLGTRLPLIFASLIQFETTFETVFENVRAVFFCFVIFSQKDLFQQMLAFVSTNNCILSVFIDNFN